ncbi:hypothetical protein IPO96_02025 [Candidatus Saccharibacteria bacterium]|nr:MAG: hypothetical protein IPO96_02025 [Candidatus Saccharibacteria bacterium]
MITKLSLILGPDSYYLSSLIKDKDGHVIEYANKSWRFTIQDDGKDSDTVGGLTGLPYSYKN